MGKASGFILNLKASNREAALITLKLWRQLTGRAARRLHLLSNPTKAGAYIKTSAQGVIIRSREEKSFPLFPTDEAKKQKHLKRRAIK